MKLVAIADLHNSQPKLPEGDILTISGDLTYRGTLPEIEKVAAWLKSLPHKHKIIIAGNHDFAFEDPKRKGDAEKLIRDAGCTYLLDSACEVEGLKIYGAPWQPWFHSWAFNVQRGLLYQKWNKIPANLDILLTHGPPFGYGDHTSKGDRAGCHELLAELVKKVPKKVFYGHIHEDVGSWTINEGKTVLYNCSIGDIYSWNTNKSPGMGVVLDIPTPQKEENK